MSIFTTASCMITIGFEQSHEKGNRSLVLALDLDRMIDMHSSAFGLVDER